MSLAAIPTTDQSGNTVNVPVTGDLSTLLGSTVLNPSTLAGLGNLGFGTLNSLALANSLPMTGFGGSGFNPATSNFSGLTPSIGSGLVSATPGYADPNFMNTLAANALAGGGAGAGGNAPVQQGGGGQDNTAAGPSAPEQTDNTVQRGIDPSYDPRNVAPAPGRPAGTAAYPPSGFIPVTPQQAAQPDISGQPGAQTNQRGSQGQRGPLGPVPQGVGGPAVGQALPQIINQLLRQQQMQALRQRMMMGRGFPAMRPGMPQISRPGQMPQRRPVMPPGTAHTSFQRALDFIKDKEAGPPGARRFDRGQWDGSQYSTGYGTKARFPGEILSPEQAEDRLQQEVAPIHTMLQQRFPNLPSNAAAAMTSFLYNLGPGVLNRNPRLAQALAAGDYRTVAQMMMQFTRSSGRFNPGLYNRRRDEVRLLLQPDPNQVQTFAPDPGSQ